MRDELSNARAAIMGWMFVTLVLTLSVFAQKTTVWTAEETPIHEAIRGDHERIECPEREDQHPVVAAERELLGVLGERGGGRGHGREDYGGIGAADR